MSISCVYCGGSHVSATEVRVCWQRAEGVSVAAPSLPSVHGQPLPERRAFVVQRGPAQLGRNVIVADIEHIPAEWTDSPRVFIDRGVLAAPEHVISLAQARAAAREAIVVVIDTEHSDLLGALAIHAPSEALHQLGPRWTPVHELLRHLITANAIDLRDPQSPRFELVDLAVAAGATVSSTGGGDVVDADGVPLWLDGGPVRHTAPISGVAVVHRVSLRHGSLRPPRPDNLSAADLAPDQRAAVTHAGGAARIIAPAGSGKTRVLTERARHLLRVWNLPPSALCLVAFNKRAQEEMVQRTSDLRGLQVRTLNAMALAVVNGTPPFAPQAESRKTIDETEVRRLLDSLVTFPRKRNADPVSPWIEALSLARLGLRSPSQVEALYNGDVDGFAEVFPQFRKRLVSAGAVDFDEQIFLAIDTLVRNPHVRTLAQRACNVMLVDEFQDLTPAHLLLIRLLAGPDGAVFGVGDDDQTIYGYNGADPAWLIDFATLFPGAGDHPLEVNYRCPGGVVDIADRLLRHNTRRVTKVIRSANEQSHGWSINADIPYSQQHDSLTTTVSAVRGHLAAGAATTDIAVLTRVNSLLVPVQVALAEAGVATGGAVGVEFVNRTAVRATLSWLRLACASDGSRLASTDLAEALRRPSRPLHPNVTKWVVEQTSLDGLRRLAQRLTVEREAERVLGFAADIERLQHMVSAGANTASLVRAVRDSVGLASAVTSLDINRRGMNQAAQSDDLTAVVQLAELHPQPATFEAWLRAHLQAPRSSTGVTLSTVHRVKGLEWPFVVVHHADADQFPHRLAEDVEEERRLFHVAITRTSNQVTIVTDSEPSPFLRELVTEPPPRSARPPASAAPPQAASPRRTTPATRPGDALSGDQAALFAELRSLRRHLAAGKPAYTVLADTTLAAIADQRPRTLAELAAIKGIGATKLELYGSAILAAVESAASAPTSTA
jgi:DNA helicase II / ATP-dependent DNA helicase PcrA